MLHIRTTKNGNNGKAVQIVQYKNRKMCIVKHIGTAHDDKEHKTLKEVATDWIEKETRQSKLFFDRSIQPTVQINQLKYVGFRYAMLYETLLKLCRMFRFHLLRNKLLIDLVIARIVEPGSKLQSIEFLKEYVGIEHRREYFYQRLPRIIKAKSGVEKKVLAIAQREFDFTFSLVFYDVTTLYFESSESDKLRQCGFSKDNKFNQPQIVLGLLVSDRGFPIGYQIFEGNKFVRRTPSGKDILYCL